MLKHFGDEKNMTEFDEFKKEGEDNTFKYIVKFNDIQSSTQDSTPSVSQPLDEYGSYFILPFKPFFFQDFVENARRIER